jgi:hypothetical protein
LLAKIALFGSFVDKAAQKSSIFSSKASFERGLFKLMFQNFLRHLTKYKGKDIEWNDKLEKRRVEYEQPE